MNAEKVEPRLIFFRQKPKDLINRPPLASSLQHLETSFLLLALHRYPHALVDCGSAIESAIKAALNARPNDRLEFRDLIQQARQKDPTFTTIHENEIRAFRDKRNEIIHYGFSPKDDSISAAFLLRTGYDLVEQCYDKFFQFPLHKKNGIYGGLLPDFAQHLNLAKKVYMKARHEKNLDFTYCFISFGHAIRWGIQDYMMSDWQKELLESDTVGKSWELKEEQKKDVTWKMFKDVSWEFDCPVCDDPDSFIVELDEEELSNGEIRLLRGVCVNCNLVIPKNCPFIADLLCEEQLEDKKPKILKEFGIIKD